MFVDVARIHVVAGNGGRGCVSFRREKYVPKGGPDGGDGGRGGSVWIEVNPHERTLLDAREGHHYRAAHGVAGSGNQRTGANGRDVTVRVPPGTLVRDAETGELLADLTGPEERLQVVKGGRGGRGNMRFTSSRQQAPRRADPGEAGEEKWIELELKLIAEVGLVGLPNAGKSTLLSRISRARPKIADYPFTTLEPHLGIVKVDDERMLVAADIPGLIAGAHAGKGLGFQFLRHIERTRMLALLVDASALDPEADARQVVNELELHSRTLAEKPRIMVLTKVDLLPEEERPGLAARLGVPEALVISAHSGDGIRELLDHLWREVNVPPLRSDGDE